MVIMGDFNWNIFQPIKTRELDSICKRNCLTFIHNSLPTHHDVRCDSYSLIDYFLISTHMMNKLLISDQFYCPAFSHHAFIFISLKFSMDTNKEYIEIRDLKSIDLNKFHETDFSNIYNTNDTNVQPDTLHSFIVDSFIFVVKRLINNAGRADDLRRDKYVIDAKRQRDMAYREYRGYKNDDTWKRYCRLRNKVKSVIRRRRKELDKTRFLNIDSKKFWKLLKEDGAIKIVLGWDTYEPDSLNEYFISAQRQSLYSNPVFSEEFSANKFSFITIDFYDLYKAIFSIKSNSIGVDGIPFAFIKIIYPLIEPHLLHFFNMILTTCNFPKLWKVARIVPICKNNCSIHNQVVYCTY
ncbi:hypothetical protein CVS40_12829 [Lucilia cuprina]|nr:hypothetical protein CVS40_12829 [Lucilia cuprina]